MSDKKHSGYTEGTIVVKCNICYECLRVDFHRRDEYQDEDSGYHDESLLVFVEPCQDCYDKYADAMAEKCGGIIARDLELEV